ncbi:hypothetical protein OUZ56_009016 [Daphnia magna]|uniref:Uncharacterized protein n=1 Tax=Daphnia magna TaxID=35525 RepID=A0ABR0AES2_9CRUS|nr:hypothetical protein OUZ56_009016 [Daphnia magna]
MKSSCRKFRRTKLTAIVRVPTLWPKKARLRRVTLGGLPRYRGVGQHPYARRRLRLPPVRASARDKQSPFTVGWTRPGGAARSLPSVGLNGTIPTTTSPPKAKPSTSSSRFAPYARPAETDLKFLNEKERAELESVQNPEKREGGCRDGPIPSADLPIEAEKEALLQREEELTKSSAARRLAAKNPEPYVPSPIVRPATLLAIQPLPEVPALPGPSTPAPEAPPVTPVRSSKSSKSSKSSSKARTEAPGETPKSSKAGRSRTSSSEKVLSKQFRKHGIHTSEDEDAVLKSPTSPYSA